MLLKSNYSKYGETMRRSKIVLILIILLFITSILSAQKFRRYDFKSGKVEYALSGAAKGTQTMFFDNYGMKEAKFADMTIVMMGMKQKKNTLTIIDGKDTYVINWESGTAVKMKTPLYNMFPKGTDLKNAGEKLMRNMGAEKTGTGTVLGKECNIWEIKKAGTKLWIWKSIPLKVEVKMMGIEMNQEATSVETDVNVPAGKFEIPKNIKITEMGAGGHGMMQPTRKHGMMPPKGK